MSASSSTTSPPLARHVREWAERHEDGHEHINVGETERLVSLAAGSGLALYGMTRGTLGGLGLALIGGSLLYRGTTGHCACYASLGVNTAATRGLGASIPAQHGTRVEESITILRPREELYRFWRELSNLPRIMAHLKSVVCASDQRSHWVAEGPLGVPVEWDAEIINERENEMIAWRSVGESEVETAGSVHFTEAPGERGTEVHVVLKYDPPAGKLGIGAARLLGQSPSHEIREDLRRFKRIMETGTVPTIEGQPRGTCS
jgi:uncharacterized membrane protein